MVVLRYMGNQEGTDRHALVEHWSCDYNIHNTISPAGRAEHSGVHVCVVVEYYIVLLAQLQRWA